MNATDDLFSQLTPEQLSALLQGGTLQDKGTLLQQELEQLLGSGMQHQEHSTPLGAGLGGIAEAVDGTANAFHAKALRGDQQKNLDAQGKLMGDFGALLRGPKDASSEYALPAFPQRPLSAPPMVQANADVPAGGMMPGLDIGQFAGPERTNAMPELDIGQFAAQPMTPDADISALPEVVNAQLPGVPNQPADPTQIDNNGSDGWGLDLSAPGHAAALAKALRGTALASRKPMPQSIHPGMPQRRGDDEELSPFGY